MAFMLVGVRVSQQWGIFSCVVGISLAFGRNTLPDAPRRLGSKSGPPNPSPWPLNRKPSAGCCGRCVNRLLGKARQMLSLLARLDSTSLKKHGTHYMVVVGTHFTFLLIVV